MCTSPGAEAKPVIFPQHHQPFQQPPYDNNPNESIKKNSNSNNNGKGKSPNDDDSNDGKKRLDNLTDSDLLINTNKKRLSVDYILT